MTQAAAADITSVLQERRVFPPPEEFARNAHIHSEHEYERLYREALEDPEGFWGKLASNFTWFTPWTSVLEWTPPHARWFVGATTNLSYNCLDRNVKAGRKNKAALIWEGEPGDIRILTYNELLNETCRFANALRKLGVGRGDRVGIYLPMIPEAAIAMLACARIGAVHSVVFGGFSADALRDRMDDAAAKVLVTADGGWRKESVVPLKENVDAALQTARTVEKVIVVRRTGENVPMKAGRDRWWHEVIAGQKAYCDPVEVDSEHPLFILYTSGSTGKPKGVLHTTGGYMVGTAITTKWVFDLKESDTYWCTADVGWVTGHSYVVYGPMCNGATSVMYEGAPTAPAPDRFWDIIERHRVNVFYTAPTAIRAFMKLGDGYPNSHDLTSLRLLGSVGEPINPEAWMWYRDVIGGGRCPIVDTWWQTETGAIMISPLPGVTPTKPGSATRPLPGVVPEIVDANGKVLPDAAGGRLVISRPWPSMLRNVWGDPERYAKTYWSDFPGKYFTGDGARRDADGYYWIMGRVDDVINVAGHRLGTMEVESALVSHPSVAEAAVVGRPDDVKGTAIAAFVTLKTGENAGPELKKQLQEHVAKEIGAIARPDDIRFAASLPKTRSGKIMRRLLRDVAAGRQSTGDISTLEDLSVLASLSSED